MSEQVKNTLLVFSWNFFWAMTLNCIVDYELSTSWENERVDPLGSMLVVNELKLMERPITELRDHQLHVDFNMIEYVFIDICWVFFIWSVCGINMSTELVWCFTWSKTNRILTYIVEIKNETKNMFMHQHLQKILWAYEVIMKCARLLQYNSCSKEICTFTTVPLLALTPDKAQAVHFLYA